MQIPDEPIIKDYYDLRQQIGIYTEDMRDVMNHPNYSLPFMQPGRLVKVKHGEHDFGWGAVINFTARKANPNQSELKPQESYILDVLLYVAEGSSAATKTHEGLPPGVRPPKPGEKTAIQVVPLFLTCLEKISQTRIYVPDDLRPLSERKMTMRYIEEVKRRFPDGIAILDPIENMGITDISFKKLLRVGLVSGILNIN